MPTVVDWERIRAEYIAGGASMRGLAEKYGLTKDAVARRAKAEGWGAERDKTATKVRQKTQEIIVARQSKSNAEDADIAARIRMKLLRRIEHELDALPETIGTESRETNISGRTEKTSPQKSRVYKLRDLTAAYTDLMKNDTEATRAAAPDFSALDEVNYDDDP